MIKHRVVQHRTILIVTCLLEGRKIYQLYSQEGTEALKKQFHILVFSHSSRDHIFQFQIISSVR